MLLVDTLFGKQNTKIPFWFMRQAGRYLPEYMEIRNKCKKDGMDFLDMCYDSDIATRITLQPIDRFDMSAAIVFSDILVVPQSLGIKVKFQENKGPVLDNADISNIYKSLSCNINNFQKVCRVITSVRKKLSIEKALIGFSGSPFTLLCYILEGGGSKEFENTKKSLFCQTEMVDHIISILTESIIVYLKMQIDAGANVLQLFDSHAGIISGKMYEKYVIKPNQQIVQEIRNYRPDVPIICFPKGSGMLYRNFTDKVPCQGISIDESCPNQFFTNDIPKNVVLQGNLNNYRLCYGNVADIISSAREIITDFRENQRPFVFNLSHGVIKHTPPENIAALCRFILDFNLLS